MIPLPVMRCDFDCGECCEEVIVFEWEWRVIKEYMCEHDIKADAKAERCPMYQQGRCAIHGVKPFICQIYGHVQTMPPCPRGYNMPISPEREQALRRLYMTGEHRLLREWLNVHANSPA